MFICNINPPLSTLLIFLLCTRDTMMVSMCCPPLPLRFPIAQVYFILLTRGVAVLHKCWTRYCYRKQQTHEPLAAWPTYAGCRVWLLRPPHDRPPLLTCKFVTSPTHKLNICYFFVFCFLSGARVFISFLSLPLVVVWRVWWTHTMDPTSSGDAAPSQPPADIVTFNIKVFFGRINEKF